MGTRNLTMIKIDGKFKVAQYCQWDGYPRGVGSTVLRFLHELTPTTRQDFLTGVRNSRFITDDEHQQKWVLAGAAPKSLMVSMEVSDRFKEMFPQLHRDIGPEVLELLKHNPQGLELSNQIEFAQNSLFCEWAYLLDFDRNVFEIYMGFNENPELQGALFKVDEPRVASDGTKYYAVRLVKAYFLTALPPDQQFLEELEEIERESESSQ